MRIEINLNDKEIAVLENDLLDIDEWIRNAIRGKIDSCKKRMINEWIPKLLQDPDFENIPVDESKLIEIIRNHKDYKSRKEREQNKTTTVNYSLLK